MKLIKKGITVLLLASVLLSSCTSVKVNSDNKSDYSVLKKDTEYTIHKKNGERVKNFRFIKDDEIKIIGILDNGKQIEIDKIDILKISKISVGKTTSILAVGVGLLIAIPSYIKNEPIR